MQKHWFGLNRESTWHTSKTIGGFFGHAPTCNTPTHFILLYSDVPAEVVLRVLLEKVNQTLGVIQVLHHWRQRVHHRRRMCAHFWIVAKFFRFVIFEHFEECLVFRIILEKSENRRIAIEDGLNVDNVTPSRLTPKLVKKIMYQTSDNVRISLF